MKAATEDVAAAATGPGGDPGTGALAGALRLAMGRIVRRLRQAHAVGDLTLSGASVLARLSGQRARLAGRARRTGAGAAAGDGRHPGRSGAAGPGQPGA